MNDCIWELVARCECGNYDKCVFKLSMDSEEGMSIERQYWQDVENAVEPVTNEYKAIMKRYKVRRDAE